MSYVRVKNEAREIRPGPRVSTDDQEPRPATGGIEERRVPNRFEDDGVSGATTKRPALLFSRGPFLESKWRPRRLGAGVHCR
jgi:hypothetical protein